MVINVAETKTDALNSNLFGMNECDAPNQIKPLTIVFLNNKLYLSPHWELHKNLVCYTKNSWCNC